jgi:colanic acid biosynthesis glycosyl transferase WcaI
MAAAVIPRCDVAVVVSPSFAALAPLLARGKLRRIPWVLWLQDILPDAAATTGLVRNGIALGAARTLERSAYRFSSRIVVISDAFRRNLLAKGVPPEKIDVVHNPATRDFSDSPTARAASPLRILAMGNIGHSQGLHELVRAFEESDLREDEARLVITGSGELADRVRAEIRTSRVEYLGLVSDATLDAELDRADVGLVSLRPDVVEFSLPSKVMTYAARGLPVLAFVPPDSELARMLAESGAGWVVPGRGHEAVAQAVRDATPDEREERGVAALATARDQFRIERVAATFEGILCRVHAERARR